MRHADSFKPIIVNQHIADVCISFVLANDHSDLFLFEIFGNLMLDTSSEGSSIYKMPNDNDFNNGILSESQMLIKHLNDQNCCLIQTLKSIGTEAASIAIQ